MILLIVVLSYPASIFIPNLYMCIIEIFGFCCLEPSSLLPIGTSHDPLMSVKLVLSLSIKLDGIPLFVLCRLYHTLYL